MRNLSFTPTHAAVAVAALYMLIVANPLRAQATTLPSNDTLTGDEIIRDQAANKADSGSINVMLRLSTPTGRSQPGVRPLPADSTHAPNQRVSVIEQTPSAVSMPKQRDPQLSPNHVVVIAYDANDNEIYRLAQYDPRIVRAEAGADTTELDYQQRFRTDVQFPISLPSDPRIHKLTLYKPVWKGDGFSLEPIGDTAIE